MNNKRKLLELHAFLALLSTGDLNEENQGTVEGLLAGCWDSLLLSDRGGMRPEKISSRLEKVNWDPPYLTFDIERHGGTVLGSQYAEIQSWKINVQEATGSQSHLLQHGMLL